MPFARSDLSRRRLLAALLGSSCLALAGCGSWASVTAGDRAALAAIARALFPYSFVPDARYAALADGVLKGDPPPAADAVRAAIRAAAPDGRADPARIPAFLATPFGQQFRFAVLVGLYDDLTLTRRFGYQGPSFPEGGYLERGFDDLEWLPEPPRG